MTGADPITAIREEDATGGTAAIFADLRDTLGVPFVNLIWRHLATIPGGLEFTWAVLKPLYADGALPARLQGLQEAIALPRILPVPAHALDCAGISDDDRQQILALIGDYNTANGVNLLGLTTALSLLKGAVVPGGRSDGSASRVAPVRPAIETKIGTTPRLIGLSELSPATLQVVRDLDGYGRLGDSAAVASLYRHLAHWPPFLALAHTALAPHHHSGALGAAQERVIQAARNEVAGLAALLPLSSRTLEGAARDEVTAALDEFTRLMIGRMVVLGSAMASLMRTERSG